MKIEVIEFYPFEKQVPNEIRGTLHIYICDLEMDVRGIFICRNKNKKWFTIMPFRWGKDDETGKPVRYPIINFTSKRKNENLKKAVFQEGVKYVEDKLKNASKK